MACTLEEFKNIFFFFCPEMLNFRPFFIFFLNGRIYQIPCVKTRWLFGFRQNLYTICYILFLTNFYILYTALTMITSYLDQSWTAIWWLSQAFILYFFSIRSPRICFKKFLTSPNCLMTLSCGFKGFRPKKIITQSISPHCYLRVF